METSFFRRRKIFRQYNTLDLIPIRLMKEERREENKINILLPRFKHPFTAQLMRPFRRSEYIPIKLDLFGSATWTLIDGQKTVEEICRNLCEKFSDQLDSTQDTQERVARFLSLLYQQRYISFKQIQKSDSL